MLRATFARAARPVFARGFAVSSRVNKDLIQDIYIKELKAYKPSATNAAAAPAKTFSSPTAPEAPATLDAAALAKELEAYDADVAPVTQSKPTSADAAASETDNLGADEYLHLVEADAAAPGAHH